MSKYLRYTFFFLLLIFQACQSTKFITDNTFKEQFKKSNRNPDSIISKIHNYSDSLNTLSGKARIQISQPGNYQRGTIHFVSDRQESKLIFRNNLGIEGGELYFDKDSALVYNKIDKFARKMSLKRYSYVYLNGLLPVNPITVISPRLGDKKVKKVYESPDYYSLTYRDGTQIILDKNDFLIRKIEYPASMHPDFSTVIFGGYAVINGYHLPRKIQILSSDKKSNIFLLIQSLEINPSNPDFNIHLPPHLTIEHL